MSFERSCIVQLDQSTYPSYNSPNNHGHGSENQHPLDSVAQSPSSYAKRVQSVDQYPLDLIPRASSLHYQALLPVIPASRLATTHAEGRR